LHEEVQARQLRRNSHTFLTMKMQYKMEWEWIKTFDWNAEGFNFFFSLPLSVGESLRFKKGTKKFYGRIIWYHSKPNNEEAIDMALNQMLFEQLYLRSDQEIDRMKGEVVILARDKGKQDLKLEYLGKEFSFNVGPGVLEQCIQNSQFMSSHRFGVKVDCLAWEEIAREAFQLSIL